MAKTLHCSFCGHSEHEVKKLVAGPGGVHICDDCVSSAQLVMSGEAAGPPRAFDPKTWTTERLLSSLAPVNAALEAHREHLQAIVDDLRARKVSWAAIGERLGVTRQSAWERFS